MNTELEIDNVQQQHDEATTDIGRLLKSKRLALNLQERDLATELKISIEKVYALENNEFERFRSATFARGYIKSYCRHVQMDYRPILKAFDVQQSDRESNLRPVDNVGSQSSAKDPIVYIVSGILIAIVVFVAFWWPTFTAESETQNAANPQQTESVQEPVEDLPDEQDLGMVASGSEEAPAEEVSDTALAEQVTTSQPDDSGVVTGLSAETIALLEDAGVDPEAVVAATREPEAPVVPEISQEPAYRNDIEIRFSADCWVEVRDNTGTILFSGVRSAGSTLTLDGEAPYKVVLGYARGVKDFIYKGESFDFSSYVRKDLARFELN